MELIFFALFGAAADEFLTSSLRFCLLAAECSRSLECGAKLV
jgi:hypothetical protein